MDGDSQGQPQTPEPLSTARAVTAGFRFSMRRMLLLMALVSVWLAGLRVLPEAWLVWLATAIFYLAIVLVFSRRTEA